ncbi:MAG: GspE/PulE family protein [Deltaproteobacteria bacterium]|nr:GspE/PulE family protein [Deltaproteobacteria bacterium]
MDAAAWLRTVEDSAAQAQKRLEELGSAVNEFRSREQLIRDADERLSPIFDSQRTYLYAFDAASAQLITFAMVGKDLKEIRVPAGPGSFAGFVALAKVAVNVRNAYDPAELARIHPKLKFNDHLDQLTQFTTKSILTLPLMVDGVVVGVVQAINKKKGLSFMPRDVTAAEEVGKILAPPLKRLNDRVRTGERRAGKWDYLLDRGALTKDALDLAVKEATAARVDPARYLIEKLGVSRSDVERSLVEFFGVEFYRFNGTESVPAELKSRLRVDFLKNVCAVPVEIQGSRITIVIDDPSDIMRTDALRSMDADREIVIRLGFRDEIMGCIDHSFGAKAGDVGLILKELSADESTGAVEDAGDDEVRGESDSAVIKLANQVIIDAYRKGASDIHIEPNGRERNTTIRFRVDGECVNYQEIPSAIRLPLVARLKIMAKLDISERRKPQDGKIRFQMQDRKIELRVATIPTVNGNEDVVMRILAASKPIPIEKMGMSDRNLAELKKIVSKPYGLVLVVGPTGSGKTTTLHSALGYINTPDTKIWTAEDPVEITQPGLRQVQVQPKIGFDFATAMRAFLRADPDVIMVGEMRDKETASTGVEASLTGHLVLSTLHTNSAPETVTRLMDMGLDPFSFADALLGVLAQRLTRALCPKCKAPHSPTDEEWATIVDSFGEEGVAKRGYRREGMTLYHGVGCESCGKSGYKGRVAIHELLVNNDSLKLVIMRKAPVEEIRHGAIEGGMTTLLQDGIDKAILGKTDIKQILAVCSR